MATNVTEKDKTLNDVIEWCGEQVSGIEKKIPTASDAALGENDRCAACDAWRHREEERRDHV